MRLTVCIGTSLSLGLGAFLAWSTAAAAADTTPGATPPAATKSAAAPDATPPAPPSDDLAVVDALDATVAQNFIYISGNRSKFQQYGTPDQGIVVPRLFAFLGQPGGGWGVIDLQYPGRADHNMLFQYFSPWKNGQWRYVDKEQREYPDLNGIQVTREARAVSVNQPILGGVALQAHAVENDYTPNPANAVLPVSPATSPPSFATRGGDVGVFIPTGPVDLVAKHSELDFKDNTGYQPNRTTHESSAELRGQVSDNISAVMNYTYLLTNVESGSTPLDALVGHANIERVARADFEGSPIDSLAFRGYFKNDVASRPFNLSGYAAQTNTAGVRMAWHGFPGLIVKSGVESRDIDYLESTGTTDHPRVRSVFGTVRYMPIRAVEMTGQYSDRARLDLPVSPVPIATASNGTANFGAITPTDTTKMEAGLAITPAPTYGLSYHFTQQRDADSLQGVIVRTQLHDWVGWAQVTDFLSVNASYGQHRYDSSYLSAFLSNADVLTLGGTATISSHVSFDTSYTSSESTGTSQVLETDLSASAHYQMGGNTEAILSWISQSFEDHLLAFDSYQMTGVTIRLRRRL